MAALNSWALSSSQCPAPQSWICCPGVWRLAMTGRPHAIASAMTIPKFSEREGRTNTSAAPIIVAYREGTADSQSVLREALR